ncbi:MULTISPECIES: hypothetical protein [unclassified Streptomyces]|uniref:hypothetical protein n=1 Tax=unclassified Streptomyces TaxID=2593676 RepID=UPI00093DB172|nr:hypothetical protein [Streptomyces sp. TSRI0281]OKI32708.1 hypothetical protein A6A29_19710 [Streptomyces sp. TSRI0281]
MRRQTYGSTGRRGTVIAASAAVLCLGGALASCAGGSGGGDGYAAVGAAAAGPGRTPTGAAAPSGKVTLVPLDRGGSGAGSGSGGRGAAKGGTGDSGRPADMSDTESAGASHAPGTPGPEPSSGNGEGSGSGTGSPTSPPGPAKPGSPGTPGTPGTTTPPAPAALQLSGPERAATDERWCEKVSMEFRNTGGSPVRSGTVTFATHIIGALGVDWATIESTQPLPAPIDAGAVRKKTYTVCVDAWRVPLGMRIETQDVTAVGK